MAKGNTSPPKKGSGVKSDANSPTQKGASNDSSQSSSKGNSSGSKKTSDGSDDVQNASTEITRENYSKYLKKYTKVISVKINPIMLVALLPNTPCLEKGEKDDGSIYTKYIYVNHNDPNKTKAYEIMNNILANPFQIETNTYEDSGFGRDGYILMLKCMVSNCEPLEI